MTDDGKRKRALRRWAAEADFKPGVTLTKLEQEQYRRHPALRGRAARASAVVVLSHVLLCGTVLALLVPVGGQDPSGRQTDSPFDPEIQADAAAWFLTAAALGLILMLFEWFVRGRPKSGNLVGWSVCTLICSGLVFWHHSRQPDPGDLETVRNPVLLCVALAVFALVTQVVVSGPMRLEHVRAAARERTLARLSPETREELLAERRELIRVLRGRNLIDQQRDEEVRTAPVGGCWRLEANDASRSRRKGS